MHFKLQNNKITIYDLNKVFDKRLETLNNLEILDSEKNTELLTIPVIHFSKIEFDKMSYGDEINYNYNNNINGRLVKNEEYQGKTKKRFISGIDDDWCHITPLTLSDLNDLNTYSLFFKEFKITLSVTEMNELVSILF